LFANLLIVFAFLLLLFCDVLFWTDRSTNVHCFWNDRSVLEGFYFSMTKRNGLCF
jgi:hypothetical protein